MRLRRNLTSALGLVALLACSSDKIVSPPVTPPTQKPPAQQNYKPIVTSSPIIQVDENSSYNYEIKATSPLPLAYSVSGPNWLNTASNIVFGRAPEVSKDSIVPVRVKIYNEKDSVIQNYNLTVKEIFHIHALTVQDTANLSFVGTDSMVFSTPTNFSIGQILASDTMPKAHDGLLRRITKFSQDKKTVYTEQPSLDEIPNLYLSFNQELLASQVTSSSGLEGVSLSPTLGPLEFSVNLHKVLLDKNPSTTLDDVVLDGNLSFSITPNFAVKINKNLSLDSLLVAATLEDSSNITVKAAPGIVPMNTLTIKEFKFPAFYAGALPTTPPIPIRVRPKLEILANFGFNLNQLETGISQYAKLTAGLKYKNGNLTPILDDSTNFDFTPPRFTKSSNIWVRVGPRLTFFIYGVAGPYGDIGGKLKFNVDSAGWQLYGGLDALIGAQMKIFSKTILDINVPVLDYEKLLAKKDSVVQPPPTTDSTFTDSRDGKTYKMIKIGNQTWMAENLDHNTTGSEYYQNNSSFSGVYGRLYNWNSSKIACPSNWHLPTVAEWKTLSDYLGGGEVSGGKIKATGTIEAGTGRWHFSSNSGATNESGFTAQPGGKKEGETYSNEGYGAYFWASDDPYATARYFSWASAGMNDFSSPYPSGYKFSTRCVKT